MKTPKSKKADGGEAAFQARIAQLTPKQQEQIQSALRSSYQAIEDELAGFHKKARESIKLLDKRLAALDKQRQRKSGK